MSNKIVEIIYKLIDKVTPEAKKIKASIESIDKSSDDAGEQLEKLQNKQKSLWKSVAIEAVAASALITAGMAKVGKSAISAAIDYEQQEMAFTSMLGSRLRAQELIADIQRVSAETPFEQRDLIEYSKKLIAVGVASSDVIPTMTMLGDVASALGTEKLPQIVRGYSDIQAAGRAMGNDLRQIRDAAVPIEQYLSKVLGVSQSEVRKLSEQSKVSAEDVRKAFELMTSEGERFHDMMKAQSETTGGAISNLKDQIGVLAIAMGQPLLKPINTIVNALRWLVEAVNNLSPASKTFISISAAVTTGVMGMVTAFGLFALAVGGAKIALIALAGSTGIGLLIGGVTLLGTAVYRNMDSIKIAFLEMRVSVTKSLIAVKEAVNSVMYGMRYALGKFNKEEVKPFFDVESDKKSIEALKKAIYELNKKKADAEEKEIADKKKALAEKKALEDKEVQDKKDRLAQVESDKKAAADLEKQKEEEEKQRKEEKAQREIDREAAKALKIKQDAEKIFLEKDAQEIERKKALNQITLEEEIAHNERLLEQEGLTQDAIDAIRKRGYDLETQRMVELDAKKKLQQSMFLDAFAKLGEGQLSIQEAVSEGILEFYKREALAAIDIEAGKLLQMGIGKLMASMFTDPLGYAAIAAAGAITSGARSIISPIKLAEGGIVMPQSGGVQATIGEGGRAEAVIPLDDPRSQEVLGGGGNSSRVIILDSDGMTTLAKGVYKKQTEMLRTGELTPRK